MQWSRVGSSVGGTSSSSLISSQEWERENEKSQWNGRPKRGFFLVLHVLHKLRNGKRRLRIRWIMGKGIKFQDQDHPIIAHCPRRRPAPRRDNESNAHNALSHHRDDGTLHLALNPLMMTEIRKIRVRGSCLAADAPSEGSGSSFGGPLARESRLVVEKEGIK